MTRKIPVTDPRYYLLSPAAGRAALKKLSLTYADPVKWIYQEQKLNERRVSKEDYPIQPYSVPPDFWPELQPVFWLPEFEAPRDQFRLFHSPIRSLPWYLLGTRTEFYSHPVHPLTVTYFLDRGLKSSWRQPRFLASPLASHRTLMVWSPRTGIPPFSLKTSVNVWIGGLNRNVRLKEIKRSVGISSLFAGIAMAELNRQGILLLDDPVGLLHRQTNAGLLVRDSPWKLDDGEEIAPIFSLLASRNGKPPRIVDLVKASKLEATTWVDEFIFRPLIYQAYFLAMTTGLVGEMHEQNILMELRDGKPTRRFWHRDLGGFGVDRDLRRLANQEFEDLPTGIHEGDLGARVPLLHLLLRMYLQESIGYAVSYALRNYFQIPADSFADVYNHRASQLQNLIFSVNDLPTTANFEKDLERYRRRKRAGFTWPWKSWQEALRDWERATSARVA